MNDEQIVQEAQAILDQPANYTMTFEEASACFEKFADYQTTNENSTVTLYLAQIRTCTWQDDPEYFVYILENCVQFSCCAETRCKLLAEIGTLLQNIHQGHTNLWFQCDWIVFLLQLCQQCVENSGTMRTIATTLNAIMDNALMTLEDEYLHIMMELCKKMLCSNDVQVAVECCAILKRMLQFNWAIDSDLILLIPKLVELAQSMETEDATFTNTLTNAMYMKPFTAFYKAASAAILDVYKNMKTSTEFALVVSASLYLENTDHQSMGTSLLECYLKKTIPMCNRAVKQLYQYLASDKFVIPKLQLNQLFPRSINEYNYSTDDGLRQAIQNTWLAHAKTSTFYLYHKETVLACLTPSESMERYCVPVGQNYLDSLLQSPLHDEFSADIILSVFEKLWKGDASTIPVEFARITATCLQRASSATVLQMVPLVSKAMLQHCKNANKMDIQNDVLYLYALLSCSAHAKPILYDHVWLPFLNMIRNVELSTETVAENCVMASNYAFIDYKRVVAMIPDMSIYYAHQASFNINIFAKNLLIASIIYNGEFLSQQMRESMYETAVNNENYSSVHVLASLAFKYPATYAEQFVTKLLTWYEDMMTHISHTFTIHRFLFVNAICVSILYHDADIFLTSDYAPFLDHICHKDMFLYPTCVWYAYGALRLLRSKQNAEQFTELLGEERIAYWHKLQSMASPFVATPKSFTDLVFYQSK